MYLTINLIMYLHVMYVTSSLNRLVLFHTWKSLSCVYLVAIVKKKLIHKYSTPSTYHPLLKMLPNWYVLYMCEWNH